MESTTPRRIMNIAPYAAKQMPGFFAIGSSAFLNQPGLRDSRLRMRVHELHKRWEWVLVEYDVGVDEGDELLRAQGIAEVVRAGEATVLRHDGELHAVLRIALRKEASRLVARGVVNDHRLGKFASECAQHRINALPHELGVPVCRDQH